MTHLPMKTPKAFVHKLASLQSRAWLPPALLLLALSWVFLFDDYRSYFYREENHSWRSAKHLTIAENLSIEHRFLMFPTQTLDADGKPVYEVYNRFPIGGYALIKLATLPFGNDPSAKIYAARTLMLLFFAAAAALAYLSLRRLASSRWIALTATLLSFSSAYCLYYIDQIGNEAMVDIFALMLVFHAMVIFEQEGHFLQLPIKACIALFLGWHVYALLLPFIAFGLMREFIRAHSSVSHTSRALYQLGHTALSLARSRYLTLGVVTLLFGISVLTFNFTNEYFALNREVPLTELPSFRSMIKRTGVEPRINEEKAGYLSWPAFPERQFYRIGIMSLPYAFSPSFAAYSTEPPARLLVILGIAASGASLLGLLFIPRYRILLGSLALSGFCWALPMRHTTAYPWHDFEALFYIGVALMLFSIVLLYLRKMSDERLITALAIAAVPVFVVSALRMAQPINYTEAPEIHKAIFAKDFESIRSMTQDGNAIFIQENSVTGFERIRIRIFAYYLAGRIVMYQDETAPAARPPDFIVTSESADKLASLTPQNQMLFLHKWDAYQRRIDQTIARAAEPLIHSHFDVYLNGSSLMYVKDTCRQDDTSEPFFLALYPVNQSDLPAERALKGFDNLDFRFQDKAFRRNERCIAIAPLPDYDIARIQTGQYIRHADGSYEHLWEGEIHLTEAPH